MTRDNAFPLVTVVIPTFNQAHYLPQALDSVLFQDYPSIEIVLCNHGSTDNTSDVIHEYLRDYESEQVSWAESFVDGPGGGEVLRRHERRFPAGRTIQVLESVENIGGSASYAEGFRAASGEYCAYLVGDDYLLPNCVTEMVAALETTRADVAYADMFVVDDAGRILQKLVKPEYSFQACLADWFHLGVCRFYRRELHDRVGHYSPAFRNANDYDMFLRFAMAGASFRKVDKVLYCTRKHDANDPSEPASWRNNGYANLIRESKECARRARAFLRGEAGADVATGGGCRAPGSFSRPQGETATSRAGGNGDYARR